MEEEISVQEFRINQSLLHSKKSGYISGKPKQDITKEIIKLPEPTDYYSDESCSTINYLRDHHTPSGLIDHDYIWQAKQQEVAEINSKGLATTEATTHQLERHIEQLLTTFSRCLKQSTNNVLGT